MELRPSAAANVSGGPRRICQLRAGPCPHSAAGNRTRGGRLRNVALEPNRRARSLPSGPAGSLTFAPAGAHPGFLHAPGSPSPGPGAWCCGRRQRLPFPGTALGGTWQGPRLCDPSGNQSRRTGPSPLRRSTCPGRSFPGLSASARKSAAFHWSDARRLGYPVSVWPKPFAPWPVRALSSTP